MQNTKEELTEQLINEAATLDDDDVSEIVFAIPYLIEGKLSFEEIHQLYIDPKNHHPKWIIKNKKGKVASLDATSC